MFDFTPSERRVIIIIVFVLIGSAAVQFFKKSFYELRPINYYPADSVFARRTHQAQRNNKIYPVSKQTEDKSQPSVSRSPQVNAKTRQLNINTANSEELKQLPRIGPSMADRIIAYRIKNGPFTSIDELRKVKGIGLKTLEKIKPYLQELD